MIVYETEKEIELLEKEIFEKKAKLIELKKTVPQQQVENYHFLNSNNSTVTLLDLFGESDELMIIHNMGQSCSYCTMWADGFSGVYHHIKRKAPFYLSSPDVPEVQTRVAMERGWTFPMISTKENTFKKDLGFEKDGVKYPGVSTFRKDSQNNIYHVAKSIFGPGDDFCSVWPLIELLPSGSEGYKPVKDL
ncbi:DUF899 family protein [Fictibacillus sp. b24]|uniref:DUF899 family protein n=1 Tax=unclassified Fictibacillus TaxID=2644029 RepID=UPI0025A248C6|nr:DUF899 family protein [Fictibacillus sp. b24]MDM5318302.1 DUF899 family protein [Fictibacillus sp. b24]